MHVLRYIEPIILTMLVVYLLASIADFAFTTYADGVFDIENLVASFLRYIVVSVLALFLTTPILLLVTNALVLLKADYWISYVAVFAAASIALDIYLYSNGASANFSFRRGDCLMIAEGQLTECGERIAMVGTVYRAVFAAVVATIYYVIKKKYLARLAAYEATRTS